jgi:HEAT repeat protein
MELSEIEANLQQDDFSYRLKAISALKTYPAEVAIPLLKQHHHDPEFLVRSFVARELGRFLTDESFALLLELARLDNTPSVRAEAANSLSLFGALSAAQLVAIFVRDDHWLVRRSILAALCDLHCYTEVWDVCQVAFANLDDMATRDAAILALGQLVGQAQEPLALEQLLIFSQAEDRGERQQAAYALRFYPTPIAKAALARLRQDDDHKVAGAALENLLP